MKPFIYLVSAASGNLGDDLISIAWIDKIRATNKQVHIFIDCVNPDAFATTLARTGRAERISVVGYLWRLTTEHANPWWEGHCRLLQLLKTVDRPDIVRLRSIFKDSRYIHFLGGGYANGIWPQNLHAITTAAFFKKQFQIPMYWTGASVHPVPKVQLFDISESIQAFDWITTRDTPSSEALSIWNTQVKHTCDDLFLTLDTYRFIKSKERFLFLNHQGDLRDIGFYVDKLIELIKLANSEGFTPVYLTGYQDADIRAAEVISRYCPHCRNIDYDTLLSSLLSNGFDIGTNSHAIVSRYHLHMILAYSGIQGNYISPNTDYYNNKHNILSELGSPFERFDGAICKNTPTGFCIDHLREMKLIEVSQILSLIEIH